MNIVLEVKDLSISFAREGGAVRGVDALSFSLREGETLAIVGESGSGKTITALSILKLMPQRNVNTTGAINFEDKNLLALSDRALRRVRGNAISMVFQEPMSSLNPTLKVGRQIEEALQVHKRYSKREAHGKAIDLLRLVGIAAPERRVDEYPHQLSGGMRQRVMIAIAVACDPKIIIADEPTTALDVTIQAQILKLLDEMKSRLGSSVIFITHDLGVVAEIAQRVVVMYAGKKVEEGAVEEIFLRPRHPYTKGLLNSAPVLGASLGERLVEMPGTVPQLSTSFVGCAFAPRCPRASDICASVSPAMTGEIGRHEVACHHPLN